jgi:type IV pilus assembly protein PilN
MIKINLLRPEGKELKETTPPAEEEVKFKEKKVKERKGLDITKLVIPLAIVLVALLFFTQRTAFNRERSLLEEARAEKKKLDYVSVKLKQLQQQKAIYEKKINLIERQKLRQGISVRIMDELSKNLPEWVWLTEATYDKTIVRIKGKALSNNLIADYISSLEESDLFVEVNLLSSTQKRIKNDDILEFSMNARHAPLIVAPPPGPAAKTPPKGGKK